MFSKDDHNRDVDVDVDVDEWKSLEGQAGRGVSVEGDEVRSETG